MAVPVMASRQARASLSTSGRLAAGGVERLGADLAGQNESQSDRDSVGYQFAAVHGVVGGQGDSLAPRPDLFRRFNEDSASDVSLRSLRGWFSWHREGEGCGHLYSVLTVSSPFGELANSTRLTSPASCGELWRAGELGGPLRPKPHLL